MSRKTIVLLALVLLGVALLPAGGSLTQKKVSASTEGLSGLRQRVTVIRDTFGVPHVTASNDHDVYFMMGYLHAEDRLFQMDVSRRRGGGTLAEMIGVGPRDRTLEDDVQLRTFGIRRSAERSLSAYSPEAMALIQAYADGVNAWLDTQPLPAEYSALEITQVPRWTPLDTITVAKLITFQTSFDQTDLMNTEAILSYINAAGVHGFDPARLFFDDIFRFAPFDNAVTVPGPEDAATLSSPAIQSLGLQSQIIESARLAQQWISPETIEGIRAFIERGRENPVLNRSGSGLGSNWWVVAGSKTNSGNAMLANDPHLPFGTPATFYEIHLTVDSHSSPMNVYGVGFAGVPGVFLGQNDRISWGATTCSLDVTDFFTERLITVNGAVVATRYKNSIEPLVIVPETFKANQIQNGVADDVTIVDPSVRRESGLSVPRATLVSPRRNNGAVVQINPVTGVSFQYTGASATRELEGFFALARARNLNDFKRGLQLLETGGQNWAYADVDGNIAAFVSGKVPLREDLQAGTIDALPPFFLRDGSGNFRHEWIPSSSSGPGVNYESVPPEEMPQVVNPAQGFLVNANNDPIGIMLDNNPINQIRGGGIYYLSAGFNPGYRAGKITSLLEQQLNHGRGHGKISFQDMQRVQSNTQMLDAEVFTPYIIRAFAAAREAGAPAELAALAGDPAVREGVGRLSNWDFSAPTGILEGFDANDRRGAHQRPSRKEVANSIAATIYTVWRSQILTNTLVATLQRIGAPQGQKGNERLVADLRYLLDNFSTNQGRGGSGLDFFMLPGIDAPPEVRRDLIILKSLKDALTRLASDAFADAFSRSTDQNDYRWGKLHRVTFSHLFGPLAPQFSIPTAGNFEDLSPTLPGLAVDGGFETIDIGTFEPLGASSGEYTFSRGAARRYVGELRRCGIESEQIIPGGQSGVIGSRFYANQLSSWLTNDYHRILFADEDIQSNQYSRIVYRPRN
jgi:penicillin amidase